MSRLSIISLILLLLVSCRGTAKTDLSKSNESSSLSEPGKTKVVLLYPEEVSGKLTSYKTVIETRGEPQLDMEELIRTYLSIIPKENQVNPFPERAGLRALFLLESDKAVIDLNSNSLEGGGSETETYRVYGLVNTLCLNFPEIKSVKILVDGQERDTFLGHIDLQYPIPPEPSLNGKILK